MNRIIGFDVARAFAIGLVLLSHFHYGSQAIGIYGVELFFALSGFLIGTILYRCVPKDGQWTWSGVANFWKRRWWRTLPNYYLFLAIAILIHYGRGEWPAGGAAGILPYFAFSQNLMSPNEIFYGPSWSLCVEEAFYLLFPLLVLLFHRVTGSRLGAFVVSGLVVLLACAALREIIFSHYPAPDARVTTLPRLDAIGYGVAMAVLAQSIFLSSRVRWGMAGTGAVILTAIIAAHLILPVGEITWFYRLALIGIPLAFSLTMPLLASWKKLPVRFRSLTLPITRISQWSYSIYLSHVLIIMAIYPLFGSYRDIPLVNLLSKGMALVVTLVVSRWVFLHFESRFTAKRPPERHLGIPAPTQAEDTSPSTAVPSVSA